MTAARLGRAITASTALVLGALVHPAGLVLILASFRWLDPEPLQAWPADLA